MADFNIAPEIGGVDTSDPSRLYDVEEQFRIVSAVFSGIELPDKRETLRVGRRKLAESKKDYLTTPGNVFVPRYPLERPLLVVDDVVFRDGEYGGFLATATGAALNAGRMVYREQTEVAQQTQGIEFKIKKERAIWGVITDAGLDQKRRPNLWDSHQIGQDLAVFAGHERGEVVTLAVNGDIDNPYLLFARGVTERLRAIRLPSDNQ